MDDENRLQLWREIVDDATDFSCLKKSFDDSNRITGNRDGPTRSTSWSVDVEPVKLKQSGAIKHTSCSVSSASSWLHKSPRSRQQERESSRILKWFPVPDFKLSPLLKTFLFLKSEQIFLDEWINVFLFLFFFGLWNVEVAEALV